MQSPAVYDAMATLNESLTYPTNRDDWYRTIIIGGVLMLFSFLLIPLFLAYGYMVRVMRSRLAREPDLPEFSDWGTLLVDGVKVWIIGLVYLLIPLIVAGVTIGGSIMSMATGTESGAAIGLAGLFGGLFVSFLLAVIFWYLAVASIVNFARTDSFGAAFDVETIKSVIFNSNYATGWAIGLVVIIAAGIIGGLLNAIPLLGFIIASFIAFYALIVAAILWTDGFEASFARGEIGETPTTDDPAV